MMTYMRSDFEDEEFLNEDEIDADVVIVGAGLCGLTCAYDILRRQAGIEVLIIEANNEIGGRVLSQDCSESFHANLLQERTTHLLKTLNVNIYPRQNISNKTGIFYTKNGPKRNLPMCYAAEVYNFLLTMHENTSDPRFNICTGNENLEELAEMSVEKLLCQLINFPPARSLCRAFICSTCGISNLNEMSALWFFIMLHGACGLLNRLRITVGDNNRYFVEGGMFQIAQKLLKEILLQHGKIRYVEPVYEVQFNDDRAYVRTERNLFKCKFVVIAVPPPHNNHIAIEPALSNRLLKTRSLYSPGRNVFFNIIYKQPFWRDCCTGNILTSWDCNTNLNLAYDATHSNDVNKKSILAGYVAHSNSMQTSKKQLFETLCECFDAAEVMNYLKYKEYNGIRNTYLPSSDTNTFGSPMSVMKPSCVSNYVNYVGAPFERVFFASSEYAINWPGTIDGAIEAGEITAYSILSSIRPQALHFSEITRTTTSSRIADRGTPFKTILIQYLGLGINIAVFLSFLKHAYDNM